MIPAYFTGVSGMTVHQEWLSVLADNVANINTIGYKKSRVTFQDAMNLYEREAIGPRICRTPRGGINPKQIGLGVADRTIDVIHSQGLGFDDSDKVTDVAISGDGYFILKNANGALYYTRAGAFDRDAQGNLVNPANGMFVQGWMAAWDNVAKKFAINAGGNVENITIKMGEILPAKATTEVKLDGNLDANTPVAIPPIIIEKKVDLRSLSQVVDGDANYLSPIAYASEPMGGFPLVAGFTLTPDGTSTITINTDTINYTSRPLSTYTTLNTLLDEINAQSGVNIEYLGPTHSTPKDMFVISAKPGVRNITLYETIAAGGTRGLWTAMYMPTGTHDTLISEKIKFTRLLDAQHPDRRYYRWEVVDGDTEEPVPMVANAAWSRMNEGPNNNSKVSSIQAQALDITKPFNAAGFDIADPSLPVASRLDYTTRVIIYSTATEDGIIGSGNGLWTSRPLSDYVSVDEFLADVNNQTNAPVTLTYDPVNDSFRLINDNPGTQVYMADIGGVGLGFVRAAKFQRYQEAKPPGTWGVNDPGFAADRAAVLDYTTLPAKGILQLNDEGKVIESYIDTDENKNSVLDRSTEIPGVDGSYSEIDSMPPGVFFGDLWSHTTQTKGTGRDYFRGTNGQIHESERAVDNQTVFNLDRSDSDNTRMVVTINNVRISNWTFANNTGPNGVDQIIIPAEPSTKVTDGTVVSDILNVNALFPMAGYNNAPPDGTITINAALDPTQLIANAGWTTPPPLTGTIQIGGWQSATLDTYPTLNALMAEATTTLSADALNIWVPFRVAGFDMSGPLAAGRVANFASTVTFTSPGGGNWTSAPLNTYGSVNLFMQDIRNNVRAGVNGFLNGFHPVGGVVYLGGATDRFRFRIAPGGEPITMTESTPGQGFNALANFPLSTVTFTPGFNWGGVVTDNGNVTMTYNPATDRFTIINAKGANLGMAETTANGLFTQARITTGVGHLPAGGSRVSLAEVVAPWTSDPLSTQTVQQLMNALTTNPTVRGVSLTYNPATDRFTLTNNRQGPNNTLTFTETPATPGNGFWTRSNIPVGTPLAGAGASRISNPPVVDDVLIPGNPWTTQDWNNKPPDGTVTFTKGLNSITLSLTAYLTLTDFMAAVNSLDLDGNGVPDVSLSYSQATDQFTLTALDGGVIISETPATADNGFWTRAKIPVGQLGPLNNDDLIEINYVRLGYSNLKPTDTFIPNGNEGPENITFSPNIGQVTNYAMYDTSDAITSGNPELAQSGDPVTAKFSHDYLYSKSVDGYDSQGEMRKFTFVFEKLDTKYWLWTVMNPVEPKLLAGYGILVFNADGSYNGVYSKTYQSPSDPATFNGDNGEDQIGRTARIGYRGIYINPPALAYPSDSGGSPPPQMGADIMKVALDFSSLLEQADLNLIDSDVKPSQDGYPMGRLEGITIDKEGIIWGDYTNDQHQPRAQIALANFNNPGGLERVAGTLFKETANSGEAEITEAKAIRSEILSKKLERSNVDLTTQFREMILAERGFQAANRIIAQVDRMIMDLMRLRM